MHFWIGIGILRPKYAIFFLIFSLRNKGFVFSRIFFSQKVASKSKNIFLEAGLYEYKKSRILR
jgi:hypothetical protein